MQTVVNFYMWPWDELVPCPRWPSAFAQWQLSEAAAEPRHPDSRKKRVWKMNGWQNITFLDLALLRPWKKQLLSNESVSLDFADTVWSNWNNATACLLRAELTERNLCKEWILISFHYAKNSNQFTLIKIVNSHEHLIVISTSKSLFTIFKKLQN